MVAWHGVRASHASVERFREAEQMGITLNYSRMGNVETALKCLDFAAETGIKLIVECDELYTESKRLDAVTRLKDHPALAGYFVMDEPHPTQFANMSKMMSDIQHVDRKHICYANIFPTGGPEHYAALGVKDYNEYIDRYMAEVPEITFLSFDKYPIIKDPNIADSPRQILGEWYQCLEIVRDRAPFGNGFLELHAHRSPHQLPAADGGRPAPTGLQQPRLRHAGAQCFTYWTPTVENPELWKYRNGPIAEDGTRTETYDIVKSVLDEIQKLSWVFLDNKVTGVYHIGTPLPLDTRALDKLPAEITELSVGRETNTACISFFENHGYHFMMAVNTDINEKCYLNVGTQGACAPHPQGRLRAAGLKRPAHADARPRRHGALHVVAAALSAGQKSEKPHPARLFRIFSSSLSPARFRIGDHAPRPMKRESGENPEQYLLL